LANGASVLAGKTAVSLVPDKAFQPFAKVAGVLQSDLSAATNPTFHLFPGQSFQMSLSAEKAGQLNLSVAGLGAAGQVSANGFGLSFKAPDFAPGANIAWSRVSGVDLGGLANMPKD